MQDVNVNLFVICLRSRYCHVIY